MRLVTYRPWYAAHPPSRSRVPSLSRLHEDMNRLFEESFGQLERLSEEVREFSPSLDIDQDEDSYTLTLEIPGVRREDVSVETRDDMVVVTGTKSKTTSSDKSESVQSSRQYGRFSQALSLPDDADRDSIGAEFADGVLTVTIPRDKERDRKRSRQIEVQQGESSTEGGSETAQLTEQQDEKGQPQAQTPQDEGQKEGQGEKEGQEKSREAEPA